LEAVDDCHSACALCRFTYEPDLQFHSTHEGQELKIVVIGLGYVGLPLAVALARTFDVIGLDIDESRIAELRMGEDRTHEVESSVLAASALALTSDPAICADADIYIVTVPTPVDANNNPDLGPLMAATRTVSVLLNPALRPIIVYESTVYPGVTEEECGVALEQLTGLVCGRDFFLGYSPERINPGDREHTIDRITKVVAGQTPEVTDKLAEVYGAINGGNIFKAASIKAAEAAKVIENTQRDVNIALMNEIAQIFSKAGISTWDVLEAARTKWNFLPFEPGLVGGHCIGVDPYYLARKAEQLGHDPRLILAGREINDSMADHVAAEIHKERGGKAGSLLVLGLTFKENVPDLRNSKVADLIEALSKLGHDVTVHDPLADPSIASHEFNLSIDLDALTRRYATVVVAVSHAQYREMGFDGIAALTEPGGLIADLKGLFARISRSEQQAYWTL
jgi:UDP-N-acetyl-D-glucosamine/UDP-N-acetyl-D-galactosamine dehydrogenase